MGAGTGDMADSALHNFTSVDAAAILENVTDGLALFEANGDIALWNGAMFAINGFPRLLFTGFRNISQAFHWQFENGHLERSHPTVEEDVAAFMTRFLSGERYVTTHLRPNGRWVHVTWRTLPDGRRLLVHRDVTELKQRELELEEARDAIERERATMQTILDNMTDGVALLEEDGEFLTVNKAFRALNEIPDDQFVAMRNLRDTYRWQATQGHVPMFGATLDEHAERNMRRFVVADGSPSILRRPSDRWVEGRYLALPDGRRLNVNRDVTELKERELELEQAHAAAERQRGLIQSIIDNLPDAVVLCEANGDIAQWNEAVYSLNGFPRHGFRNIADAFRWQTQHHQIAPDAQGVEELVANLMRMFLSGEPYRVTRRRPNGNWIESIWKSLADGRRMIIGRDVTELKEHEQELARERELMQTMLDNMGDGVVLAQPSGEWILVNKPLYRINGWPEDVHSNSCSYDDVRWLLENGHLERKLATLDADIERIRLRFVDADGTPKDFRRSNGTRVEVRWIKLPDERRLGMYRDITALKQQEQRIAEERDAAEAARAEAEAANNAKSTFLATMSHEIRTPMNGVLGMMEVLEHQGLDDAQRATVATMRESAVALLRIIDDVLDFSKIEAGRMELEETAFSLSELVTSTVQTFRPQASAKHLRVGATIEPASADALIGDPVRVRQILFNLISNAVKFTEQGSVHVRARTAAVGEGRQHVTLTVTDTGIGMNHAERARLFQPFSQADNSTTRRFGGTGLGLSIVRRLAHLMDGDVAAESAPDQGSIFTVTLALRAAPPDEAEAVPFATVMPRVARGGDRVLVADDHPVNRQVLLRQLSLIGLSADTAADGIEALSLWRPRRYAVVLADMHMPRMDGYGLTSAIRAEEARLGLVRTPIVAVTANAMRGEEERCIEAGMDAYLAKPVALGRLTATLGRWVALTPQDAASPLRALEQAPAAFDLAALRDWFGEDVGAIRAILDEFIATAQVAVEQIATAVAVSGFAAIMVAAHRVRGAALTVGARPIGNLAARLEEAARAGDAATCREAHKLLVVELRRAEAFNGTTNI